MQSRKPKEYKRAKLEFESEVNAGKTKGANEDRLVDNIVSLVLTVALGQDGDHAFVLENTLDAISTNWIY